MKTYIYQIFSNKCVDAIRKKTTKYLFDFQRVSIDGLLQPLPDNKRSSLINIIKQQDYEALHQKLEQIGDKCQDILKNWSEGFTDDEIAKAYAYNSAGVAQTTRLRCLEKLRTLYIKKTTEPIKIYQ